jgi:EAL domain-containing protein (putative c-di-GMP-specific phosphodiesterase class I)/CHASE2 domain-containing sensor protein
MRAFFRKPLVIATLVACICGLLKLGQPLDHIYWHVRFRLPQISVPDSIVLVTVDDEKTGRLLGDSEAAGLIRTLVGQAPKQIYIDRPIDFSQNTPLTEELSQHAGKVTLVRRVGDLADTDAVSKALSERSAGDLPVVYSGWYMDFMRYAQGAPQMLKAGGKEYPSFANALAGSEPESETPFIPNFSVDPDSVLTVPAAQLLNGGIAPGAFTGRSVIVSGARRSDDALIGYFGHGRINPVSLDIAGAVSINSGNTANIGGLPLLAGFISLILLGKRLRRKAVRYLSYGITVAFVVLGPMLLQMLGIYSIPEFGIIACAVYGGIEFWSKWRRRVLQTNSSGLPNFVALNQVAIPEDSEVVVATISRYEEMLATLPQRLHAECAQQIARRFAVGAGTDGIYQGEGGYFAWVARTAPPEQQSEHFEGLRALFSAPLLVGGHMFDTNVHFGLDRNSQFDTTTRLNAALASAHDAQKAGRTIEQFEAKRLADAPWELSLLARIDEGMKNGDIWVAYQPQWDYAEGAISGAEALVRWNDPQRGPIRPDAFIVQAEKAGRIDALTYWVFEQAISAAQEVDRLGNPFQMSINLSALLVDKPSLISSVAEIARRRNIDCRRFTIEITETAGVYNRPAAVQNLQQLRAMGFRLAIDDFGTGESSLLYLAELPSDELKIDQHFVSRIATSEREREIVNSTIRLAHALKQTVVAEGIEDQQTFDMLRQMGCDTGQGFFIGRPGTFDQLLDTCMNRRKQSVGS